jgi:hypothetical protein
MYEAASTINRNTTKIGPYAILPVFHERSSLTPVFKLLLSLGVFYLPTDAQENCFKKNIKIYIKTAPTCFGLITISRERTIRAS